MATIEQTATDDTAWVAYELSTISLGDRRLDWRLLETASRLAARPTGSIHQACHDWADTRGAYRLLDNPKTTAPQILAPHQQRTCERMADEATVLVLQDTSLLDYSHHPAKQGLGPLGTTKQKLRGLLMHTALAVTTEGVPLGIVSQAFWARSDEVKAATPAARRKVPIAEKESIKWLNALDDTVHWAPPGTQVVTVGDSEADVFELFDHARTLQTDLLIRAGQPRALCAPEVGNIWDVMAAQPVAGHLRVHVAAHEDKPARDASVTVQFAPVTLRTPQHLQPRLANLPLAAILVQEVAPPPEVEPLLWLLLTTVAVPTFAAAVERIQWYCQRWKIEIYHKTLKSGCQVERSQLAKVERLLPLLALYSIIAWRLMWMTYLARHDPDAPCTTILAPSEWQALYAYTHKSTRLPSQVPTVADAVLWIARLGGYLARRHDGPPGVTVIWRGWQRLADITATWLIFHPHQTCG